jgi:hypothetical protein
LLTVPVRGAVSNRHSFCTLFSEQAEQSAEFAEALGHYLFVVPSRVTRGIEQAKAASGGAA